MKVTYSRLQDAVLLKALAEHYRPPHQIHFDATTISTCVSHCPALFVAMDFLKPRLTRKSFGYRWLHEATKIRLRKWFDRVEGHVIDGMRLERDAAGWCYVKVFSDEDPQ